jgi:hypothetical protein
MRRQNDKERQEIKWQTPELEMDFDAAEWNFTNLV